MPRKRTKPAVKQAQTLLDWLITLELPTRVQGALRRDLEIVIEQWEGELGDGVLAGVDQARFAAELYRDGGGLISRVPSVGPSAIAALRAVIAAPISADGAPPSPEEEMTPPAPSDAAPTPAAPSGVPVYGDDFVLLPLEDAEAAAPVEAAMSAEALEPTPAAPSPAEVAAPAEAIESAPVSPAPAEAPTAPMRRRGRPPRVEMAPTPLLEPPASAEAPVRRRGRLRRSEVAPAAPAAATEPAQDRTATAAAPPAPELLSAVLPVPDPSADVLLGLWRELHPQGRQATLYYMAGLLIEG